MDLKALAREVKEEFRANKKRILEGKTVGLPIYEFFPRLGQFIPTIPPATQVMITAGSGIGKSNSWAGIILLTIFKLQRKYPDRKFKFKVLISLLEDNAKDFMGRLYTSMLLLNEGDRTDILELKSMKGHVLSDSVDYKLDKIEDIINEFLDTFDVTDTIYNPTGLYKWGRAISNTLGVHHTKEMDFSDENGDTYKQEVYSHYVPHDPDQQVIWIVDNLNNLQPEKGEDRLSAINKWTSRYGRLQITKHWKWTVVNIMQQASESERPQYDLRGNLVIDKVKTSLDGLGNSKESQRDHSLIFGLWAPNRFGINNYEGYNIARLKDSYRSFIILKSNISETNKEIPMYFDGATSIYKELPKIEDMTETIYKIIENREVNVI